MIVQRKVVFVLGLFYLLVSLPLYSQVKIHKNLNIDDGLVYSQILVIHEDQQGYMWFGTSSGISRWDGISFKNFILPEGLSDNNCKWVVEFKDSTMVFATRKGIVQYKNDKFSIIPETPSALNHWIHSMLVSTDNKLYIATDTSGLWIYDGQYFSNIDSNDGLPSNSVQALIEGANGQVYLGFSANSIVKYKDRNINKMNIKDVPDDIVVNTLFEDENEVLWIGTEEHGIFVYNQERIIKLDHDGGLPSSTIMHITQGESNQIYAATDEGLAIIENYKIHSVINEKNGLSYNFIWYIKKDRNGVYYLGTDGGGVDIFRPGLFETINENGGLPNNTVWAICETADHEFYFGTDEGLLRYTPNNMEVINTTSGLSDNMILCLLQASDGKIYAGTNEQGVDVIDNTRIFNINEKQGLHGPSVWTITEDKQGLIYFGTYDEGVNIWNGEHIIDTINVEDGLATNAIVSSYLSLDGSLYFGTDGGGVFRFVNGQVDTTLLNGNTVWSIYEDKKGNMYFGTNDRGMIFFRKGKWDTLSINNGLSHNSILGILEDDQGKLHLTADNGLNIINFNSDGYHIRILGKGDGLASNECNQGAYYKDSQGYLWFGTINGVSRFNPVLSQPTINAPVVHITDIQLFDKNLPVNEFFKNSRFSYNENYFNFEFIGIDLSAPQKVAYKYRLSGMDSDWKSTNHPSVQYTNLDDGAYTFEAKAGNEWNYWSDPVRINFAITAPFWERWWFIIASFLIIISPFVIVIRQRINRLLALERLRSRIAADLHDDIGAGLSEINILSAVAVSKTPDAAKPVAETELKKIGVTARSLIESMSDIVWLVNPKKDAVADLIYRLKDSFNDVFEAKEIIFSTENTQALQKVRLEMEYRHNLYLILKESIHNAIKYSQCSRIHLRVRIIGKSLEIQMEDNGKGFDRNKITSGNGLTNMEQRAAKISGSLTINSIIDAGTQVIFWGKA